MTFSLSKSSIPHINTLENHSPTWLGREICDLDCFKLIDNVKYLGIYFDEDTKWKTQISLLIKRLRKLFNVFKKLHHVLDIFTLRSVYSASAQSVLSYGIFLWGSAYPSTVKPLNTTHRILIKIALKGYRRTNTLELFDILKVFNLKQFLSIFQKSNYILIWSMINEISTWVLFLKEEGRAVLDFLN